MGAQLTDSLPSIRSAAAEPVVNTTIVFEQDQTERFAFTAPCSSPTTYGFKVPDGAGVAGLIVTINHCGEEANSHSGPRWKCSSSCEDGWEAPGFDDSAWLQAASLGVNGNPPWSHHEVSDGAYWIWNSESGQHGVQDDKGFEHDDRQACCRYVSDHRPINCNAARMRYTHDYLLITQCGGSQEEMGGGSCGGEVTSFHNNDGLGSQGYSGAWTHFTATGEASGYIWHSEMCTAQGTDWVQQDCIGCEGQMHVTGVGDFEVSVNGFILTSGQDWTRTHSLTFNSSCWEPTVYAVRSVVPAP